MHMDDFLTGFAVERLQGDQMHDRIANVSRDPVNALKGAAEALNLMFRPLNQGRWYAAVVDLSTRTVEFGVTSSKLEHPEAAGYTEDQAKINDLLFGQGVETIPLSAGVADLVQIVDEIRYIVTMEGYSTTPLVDGVQQLRNGRHEPFEHFKTVVDQRDNERQRAASADTRYAELHRTLRQTRAALIDRTRELYTEYLEANSQHRTGKIMRDKLWEAEYAYEGAVKMLGTFLCYTDADYDVEDEAGAEHDARLFAAEPRSEDAV